MKIIARNIRSPIGEVDIVALDGETLVFIEVKTWRTRGVDALEHGIDERKQTRIIETARYFLSEHQEYCDMAVRFDVVFIGIDVQGNDSITHLDSAFTEGV